MANLTNGKVVIDEIVLDDDADEMENSSNCSDIKEHFNSRSFEMNGYQIEQGRGNNGYENGDDDEMDYEEIAQVNQPVDFIFAVEDDDGVETEFDTQKIFSSELNENKLLKHESPVKTTPQAKLLHQSSSAKLNQPIRTRSALRQQSNPQNGHSNPTSTPTTNGIKKKVPETVESIPAKQLRSSVRETRSVQNKTTQPTPTEPKSVNKKATNIQINTNHSTQPTPTEPKSVNKKATNIPINTNHSTQPTPNELKSANRKIPNNNNSTPNGGTKNGKKSVTVNKVVITTQNINSTDNRTAFTTNDKQNGTSTNGKSKTNKNSTETPVTDGKTVITKKRPKSYWNGKEHGKLLGPDAPYVMIERLSLFLSGQTEYRGHDCLTTPCPAKRIHKKAKSPAPPPRIEPFVGSLSSTINSAAKNIQDDPSNLNIPPGRPRIGQTIRFQFWQTPLGNNIPAKSSFQKAKIIGYYEEYDLYEIKLFHYDHPFIITKDKSKNQRITTNTMVIDWDSLADPSII